MYYAAPSLSSLRIHLNTWAINNVNRSISQLSLPFVDPISRFSRACYAIEHDGSSTITEFQYSNAGHGNRAPRRGRLQTRT